MCVCLPLCAFFSRAWSLCAIVILLDEVAPFGFSSLLLSTSAYACNACCHACSSHACSYDVKAVETRRSFSFLYFIISRKPVTVIMADPEIVDDNLDVKPEVEYEDVKPTITSRDRKQKRGYKWRLRRKKKSRNWLRKIRRQQAR